MSESDESETDSQSESESDSKSKSHNKNNNEIKSNDTESEIEDESEPEDIPYGDVTTRIGLVNLDWEHLRAVDILVALNSFCRPGDIKSVTIYPSDYGLQRIVLLLLFIQKEEEEYGPEGRIVVENPEELDDDPKALEKQDMLKLREYEKQKLKYYFAVVECNSLDSASALYDQCDGFEFLQSGNIFDMRYIPDDVKFDREIRDSATEVPENYEPVDFSTTALDHTNVKLTWDEEEPEDRKVLLKWGNVNLKDIETDFSTYIGNESSDSDEEAEDKKKKYQSLLKELHSDSEEENDDNDDNESDNGEKEITFVPSIAKEIETV